jgi:hypothetical protein
MWNVTKGIVLSAVILIAVVSCGDRREDPLRAEDEYEAASIAFKLSSTAAALLASVEVVVSGVDFIEIREQLELSGEVASGVIQVPVGTDRLFTLNGYDEFGALIFTGQGWSDIVSGSQTTVALQLRPVDATADRDWLHGVVPDLTYVNFYASTKNWDSDAEDDGIRVTISYYNSDDRTIRWEDATISIIYRVYIATEYGNLARKYESPWIEYVGHLSSNGETFRIAFEDFGSYGVDDTYNTLGGDVAVPVIEELTVTMSNGARYNARDTGGIIVAD